jgi:predicted permease
MLEPMRDDLYGWATSRFAPFMGIVACVLLLVAANLANLVLVRATNRGGELAVRAALGAGRGRLARQVVLEVALVTAAAAALGTLLTSWGISLLVNKSPWQVAQTVPRLDARVATFAVAAALLAGLFAALAPALSAATGDFLGRLQQSARQASGGGAQRLARRALVVFQIACSLLLLTGAGLLTKTIIRMQQHDPGFEIDNLVNLYMTIPEGRYESAPERALLVDRLLDHLRAVPGVVSASITGGGDSALSRLTQAAQTEGGITLEGHDQRLSAAAVGGQARSSYIGEDYLATLGVPILRGRSFVEADGEAGAPLVAIVNEEAADRWWPAGDALGKRFKLGPPDSPSPWITVVGVVRTYRSHYVSDFAQEDAPRLYLPLRRDAMSDWPSYYVRTAAAPGPLVGSFKAAIEEVDPAILFHRASHLRDERDSGLDRYAVDANVLLAFALFGVVIAAMGVYGVVAYGVAHRTREIGIRKALGARTGHVFRTVTRESVILAAIGIAAGLALSAALTRGLESMLHGLSPLDPTVYAVVSVLLALVVALATWLPARRATRVDPVVALRMD